VLKDLLGIKSKREMGKAGGDVVKLF